MTALVLVVGFLIGVTLGALGGGGSILTVPVLVYLFGQSPQSATTASLVIVGLASAVAAVGHARRRRVSWLAGSAFGAAGVPAAVLGSRLNAVADPDLVLVSVAVLMLVAASAMLATTMTPSRPEDDDDQAGVPALRSRSATAAKVVVAGLVVGFLTGFLGVGGGFVIVPALVLALRYDMPTAVGTSLLVISLNSGVALLARGTDGSFAWAVILPFTLAAVVGSLCGKRVADEVSAAALTRSFAALLLLVAVYVLARTGLGP